MSHDPQPGPGGPHPTSTGPQPPLSQGDERLWAAVAHVSIPFVGFVVPLIVWLAVKDQSAWLRESVAEALNFSILYTVAQLVAIMMVVVVLGMLLMPLLGLAGLILCILGAVAANRGESYHYPVNLRLVK